jgi:hypothetical protein
LSGQARETTQRVRDDNGQLWLVSGQWFRDGYPRAPNVGWRLPIRSGLRKSASNLDKHGIDFADAQLLWDDPDVLEIPAKTDDEPRWLAIGKILERHWSCVFSYRGEAIRIISVRRSRVEEVALYESQEIR